MKEQELIDEEEIEYDGFKVYGKVYILKRRNRYSKSKRVSYAVELEVVDPDTGKSYEHRETRKMKFIDPSLRHKIFAKVRGKKTNEKLYDFVMNQVIQATTKAKDEMYEENMDEKSPEEQAENAFENLDDINSSIDSQLRDQIQEET